MAPSKIQASGGSLCRNTLAVTTFCLGKLCLPQLLLDDAGSPKTLGVVPREAHGPGSSFCKGRSEFLLLY